MLSREHQLPQKRRDLAREAKWLAGLAADVRAICEAGAARRELSREHPYSSDVVVLGVPRAAGLGPDAASLTLRIELEASPVGTPYHARLMVGLWRTDGTHTDVLEAADDGLPDVPARILDWPDDPALRDLLPRFLFTVAGKYPYGWGDLEGDEPAGKASKEVH